MLNKDIIKTALENARSGIWIVDRSDGSKALRSGAAHRNQFWRGYHHAPTAPDNSMGYQFYKAGKLYRKETSDFIGLPMSGTNLIMKDGRGE